MPSLPGKILITAFEPFGLTGALRKNNASKQICDFFKDDPDYDILLLPVSSEADTILEEALKSRKPSAVLSLGENLGMAFNTVQLEPFAYDTTATVNPFGHVGRKTISSPFAQATLPENAPCDIGTYHCNSVYKTALKWSLENGELPVGFAHIAVLDSRGVQKQKVDDILYQLKYAIDF